MGRVTPCTALFRSIDRQEPAGTFSYTEGGVRVKITKLGVGIILVFVIAVAIAGCSGTSQPGSGAGAPSGGAAPAGGSAPKPGSVVSGADLFGNAKVTWYEYQITSKAGGETMRSEMRFDMSKETYKGAPATHTKMTTTMTSPMSSTTIVDVYSDASGASLGGHMKMIANGQTVIDKDLPASSPETTTSNPNAVDTRNPYTFAGVESVTVPAGSFPAASHYTMTIQGVTGNYWTAQNVPVFIKSSTKAGEGDMTMELKGWG